MAQRAIGIDDLELILSLGTEVEDGYLIREKDFRDFERKMKSLMAQAKRLRGKRIVVAGNEIITIYHTNQRDERRLLRRAEERNLER
jgi:hypothetical protein